MDLKQLEAIMKLMRKHQIYELSLDEKETGDKLQLKVGPDWAQQMVAPVTHQVAPLAAAPRDLQQQQAAPSPGALGKASESMIKPGQKGIKSPFVGTYYESSSPGSDPFVKVGRRVSKGDVLCIIEAMKLMNEIEADADGTIVALLARNEQPVEYDQLLFIIE